jgi:hypothetical protein
MLGTLNVHDGLVLQKGGQPAAHRAFLAYTFDLTLELLACAGKTF